MMTSVAASVARKDQPSTNAAKIKTASHTEFLTHPFFTFFIGFTGFTF